MDNVSRIQTSLQATRDFPDLNNKKTQVVREYPLFDRTDIFARDSEVSNAQKKFVSISKSAARFFLAQL